jgi:hypothetical protein
MQKEIVWFNACGLCLLTQERSALARKAKRTAGDAALFGFKMAAHGMGESTSQSSKQRGDDGNVPGRHANILARPCQFETAGERLRYRQPSAGATCFRIASMTWAL